MIALTDLTEYKKIPEYPQYLVSKYGDVYSTKSNIIMTCSKQSAGYYRFGIQHNNKPVFLLLHRVLCRVYKDLPTLDSKLEVDHIDGNKDNNKLENLQVLSKELHLKKTLVDKGHTPVGHCICGVKLSNNSNKQCITCKKQSFNISSIEEIEYWVTNFSWSRAGRELGISDNGLRKRYKKLTGKNPSTLTKIKPA